MLPLGQYSMLNYISRMKAINKTQTICL